MKRRSLLFAAGAGVLGVTVLSACSSPAEPAPGSSAPPPGSPAAPTGWERVNLGFVSAYLLVRGSEVAIVDLGTSGSEAGIGEGLKAAGSGWANVKHVILTHRHDDHVGGLSGVQPQVKATWYAGEADVSGIRSETALKPVKDGDEIFGLRIIGTPGHTAGHVSVFDPATGVLVAGDALRTTDGLVGSDPQYTLDPAQAAASVKKLAGLDIKQILPGHGDPLTAGSADALKKLAATVR
ncbi:MBL fold metallo-hydrolase [Actinoplanes sp. NPDC089786]|uniref:MBL fold metallo-hydrolase n=1 Tax=Actinoplanes sp. NPDC089786 TaxID=3155185 RepID=UPI003433434E